MNSVTSITTTAVLVLFVACCSLLLGNATATPPPNPSNNLPIKFFDPNMTSDIGFGLISGPMWYDADFGADRIDFYVAFAPGYLGNYTSISNNVSSYFIINDVCRILPGAGAFQSLFAWVLYASYNGPVTIDGRDCDEWIFYVPQLGGDLVLDVLSSNDSIPVRFIAPFKPFTTNQSTNATYLFSPDLTIEPVNTTVFDVPIGCYEKPVCPAGPTVNTSFYLFHDANDFTLINTNVADVSGDVAFVCFALLKDQFTYFSWVSQYNVELNTTFGQYGLCNFGSCIGASEDRVGKEAADGLGPHEGQCTNNTLFGNWFSLPAYNSSLCPEYADGTIGVNGSEWYGCGWNVMSKVKTIDGSCLEQNGFEQACRTDVTFPFPTAHKVWNAAFATEDPSMGGCPTIGPETNTNIVKIAEERRTTTVNDLYEARRNINYAIELAIAARR